MTAHAPTAASAASATSNLVRYPYPQLDLPEVYLLSQAVAFTAAAQTQTFKTGKMLQAAVAYADIQGCMFQFDSFTGGGGVVEFEASTDGGGTWAALTVSPWPSGAGVTNTNAPGVFFVSTVGKTNIRLRVSSLAGGATINGAIFGNQVIGMRPNVDYWLRCPIPITQSYPNSGGLKMSGGRRILIRGFEIYVPDQRPITGDPGPASVDTYTRAIYTELATGYVHLEGGIIAGADCSDGIQLYSNDALIQIQNCVIGTDAQPMTAHDKAGWTDKHPDCIEAEGGWRELIINKCTMKSNYQVLFMNQVVAKHGRRSVIDRVNMKMMNTGVPTGLRQGFWQGDHTGATELGPEVYLEVPTELSSSAVAPTLLNAAHYYGTSAEPDLELRSFLVGGTKVAWNPKSDIVGSIKAGPPPGGDFCRTSDVGCAYAATPADYMEPIRRVLDEHETNSPALEGRAIVLQANKFKAATIQPSEQKAACAPPVSRTVYEFKMMVHASIYELAGLVFNVEAAGVNLTAGRCWVCLYDRKGNLIAGPNATEAVFNAIGEKLVALTGMPTYLRGSPGDFYKVGMVMDHAAGSLPEFGALESTAAVVADLGANILGKRHNVGVDGTLNTGPDPKGKFVIRFGANIAAQNTLPGTISFGSSVPTGFAPFIGLR